MRWDSSYVCRSYRTVIMMILLLPLIPSAADDDQDET